MPDRGTWKVDVAGAPVLAGRTSLADYDDVVARDPVSGGPVIDKQDLAVSVGATNAPFQVARGNYYIKRGFKLTKEFATNKLSCDWFELAAQTYSGIADVIFTHKDYSGVETKYKVFSAHVEVTADEPIGVCCQAKVSVSGGLAILQA
jgi:hypothetical protein